MKASNESRRAVRHPRQPPALEAALVDVFDARVDRIVVGGDVVPGPMPRETLALLSGLDVPVDFIHGNGDLAVLAQVGVADRDTVTYWGTTSGEPLPETLAEVLSWSARQLHPDGTDVLRRWPKTHRLEIPGLGRVLFCHGTPRSETECFTRLTPERLLVPVFEGAEAAVVVCGHTHMPFDRLVAGTRVVNAGSVGMPFGQPGADWLLLGPEVQRRHTAYDLQRGADRIRKTSYPQAREFADDYVVKPPSEAAMLDAFTYASFR